MPKDRRIERRTAHPVAPSPGTRDARPRAARRRASERRRPSPRREAGPSSRRSRRERARRTPSRSAPHRSASARPERTRRLRRTNPHRTPRTQQTSRPRPPVAAAATRRGRSFPRRARRTREPPPSHPRGRAVHRGVGRCGRSDRTPRASRSPRVPARTTRREASRVIARLPAQGRDRSSVQSACVTGPCREGDSRRSREPIPTPGAAGPAYLATASARRCGASPIAFRASPPRQALSREIDEPLFAPPRRPGPSMATNDRILRAVRNTGAERGRPGATVGHRVSSMGPSG